MIKSKRGKLKIAHLVIMAALLVFIILMLTSNNTKEISMSDIEAAMLKDDTIAELTEKSMGDAAQAYSLDVTLLEDGIYRRIDDVMDVRELFIVNIDDDTNRQTVIDAVEKYLAEKTESFDGYGTDQHDLLSHAITTEKGTYYFFGVSEDVTQWEAEFLSVVG